MTRLPALQPGNIGDSDVTNPALQCTCQEDLPADAGLGAVESPDLFMLVFVESIAFFQEPQ